MKIAFLTHQYFPRHIGGTEVFVRSLVRRAVADGDEPIVITVHESTETSRNEVRIVETAFENVPVFEIHFNLSLIDDRAKAEYDNEFVGPAVRSILQRFAPDVAHVAHAMKLSCAAIDACAELNIPIVVTLSDFWFICPRATLLTWDAKVCDGPKWPMRCLQCLGDLHGIDASVKNTMTVWNRTGRLKRSLLKAEKILALTKFQKDTFVRNGYPAERITVVEHGVETDTGGPVPRKERPKTDPFVLGFAGNLVEHKGPHLLAEALQMVPELDIRCEVYGPLLDSGYVRRLQKYADADRRFVLKGGFPPEKLFATLGSFDAFAMPALWHENGPLVVKAALMQGVPVVASKLGSLRDMVEPGRTGWLVPSNTPRAWADAIVEVCRGPRLTFEPLPLKTAEETATEIFAIYRGIKRKCPA